MRIERKLYTQDEVKTLIVDAVAELNDALVTGIAEAKGDRSTIIAQWSEELLPSVEQAVAEEVSRRHVQGITFSIWAGPPASGKGTNIQTLEVLGKAYAEVVSQGFEAQLPPAIHKKLLAFSVDQATVQTGTGGIFNNPKGEYRELFAGLDTITAETVARGFVPEGDVASPLVELMILLRLVQDAHRIQVDLWPRRVDQLEHYVQLVQAIRDAGGKVAEEFVSLRLLDAVSLGRVEKNPTAYAEGSLEIGAKIEQVLDSQEYATLVAEAQKIAEPKQRYAYEDQQVQLILQKIAGSMGTEVGSDIVSELLGILKRMDFRFNKELEVTGEVRPDAYPLTVLRRLKIYVTETAASFLLAPQKGISMVFVSVYYSPAEVIKEICGELIGKDEDPRWNALVTYAGEIADDIVHKRELIVDAVQQRVWGIVSAVN